ncbi:MAG: sigma-70 family RNA polymerase sigma factor [Desulfotomaculum sp.]|nr:sigma-70 family RNA polymerase sigma factor [Desulfotomaculum sp.]
MDKSLFSQTEKMLYQFWKDKLRLERLQSLIQKIEEELEDLQDEIYMQKPVSRVIAVYGKTGGRGSYRLDGIDGELAKHDDIMAMLVKRYYKLNRRRLSLKFRVSELQEKISYMEAVINQLDTDEKRIIEYRYLYKHSNYAIAKIMKYTEGTIRYKRRRLIKKVAEALDKKLRKFYASKAANV